MDADDLAGQPPPLEARSLLRGVLADVLRDERGAETMRWIAREAEGERLDEMAREASLPAATVRQRVSRLRRWLRKRWLREAALLAATVGIVGVLLLGGAKPHGLTPIVGDPMGDPAAAASAALQGRWRVASVEPDVGLAPARRALVDADATTTVVEVDSGLVRFTSATHHAERRLEVGAVDHGRFEVGIIDGGGGVQRATASLDASGRLVVVGAQGDWQGRVTLVR